MMPTLQEVAELLQRHEVPRSRVGAIAAALRDAGLLDPSIGRPGGDLVTAVVQQSVEGYCAPGPDTTVSGTWEHVTREIDRMALAFYDRVEQAWNRHGDHRNFCPQLGNGYPSRDPSGGDVVRTGVLSVRVEQDGVAVDLTPGDPRFDFLRKVADAELQDPLQALEDLSSGGRLAARR